jgi:hypothetical protein
VQHANINARHAVHPSLCEMTLPLELKQIVLRDATRKALVKLRRCHWWTQGNEAAIDVDKLRGLISKPSFCATSANALEVGLL